MRVKDRVKADKDKVGIKTVSPSVCLPLCPSTLSVCQQLVCPPVCLQTLVVNPEFFKYCHDPSVCPPVCLQVLVVNPEFFKYCHDHWTERHGRYPSTGLVALIFALHTCDQVPVCCTY